MNNYYHCGPDLLWGLYVVSTRNQKIMFCRLELRWKSIRFDSRAEISQSPPPPVYCPSNGQLQLSFSGSFSRDCDAAAGNMWSIPWAAIEKGKLYGLLVFLGLPERRKGGGSWLECSYRQVIAIWISYYVNSTSEEIEQQWSRVQENCSFTIASSRLLLLQILLLFLFLLEGQLSSIFRFFFIITYREWVPRLFLGQESSSIQKSSVIICLTISPGHRRASHYSLLLLLCPQEEFVPYNGRLLILCNFLSLQVIISTLLLLPVVVAEEQQKKESLH